MSDYNATFAVNNRCTRLNTGGTFGLCDPSQTCGNSLKRVQKAARKRARKSHTAGENCCRGIHNTLNCGCK